MKKRYLLAQLGGGNRDLLADGQPAATTGERMKFNAMGGVLLTTAGVAAVSMFFALRHAVGADIGWSVALGALWGVVILNLDRFLVVTMNGARGRKTLLGVTILGRLLVAALVSTVVSMPLVLVIFASDINAELPAVAQQKSAAFKNAINNGTLQQQINELEAKIKAEEAVVHGPGSAQEQTDEKNVNTLTLQANQAASTAATAKQKWQCEIGGLTQGCPPATSGIPGNSYRAKGDQAIYDADQEKADTLSAELTQARSDLAKAQAADQKNVAVNAQDITNNQQTINGDQTQINNAINDAEKKDNADHGLLAQVQALFEASSQSAGLAASHWLVAGLFFMIEFLPVGIKTVLLLGPKSAYETIAEDADQKAITAAAAILTERDRKELEIAKLNTQAAIDQRKQELDMLKGKQTVDATVEADMRARELAIRLWASRYVDRKARKYIKAMLVKWAQMIDDQVNQARAQQQSMNGQHSPNGQQSNGQSPNGQAASQASIGSGTPGGGGI